MEIEIDLNEINGLSKWCLKNPRQIQRATAKMLNEFAFGTRSNAIEQISKHMTVRAPGFVRKQMWTEKTTGSLPVSQQVSKTGSLWQRKDGTHGLFTGWIEQEKGNVMLRHRMGTLSSRGGSKSGKMKPSNRLKPGNKPVTIADYNPTGGLDNFGGFVAMLAKRGEKRLAYIKGSHYRAGKGSSRKMVGPGKMFRRMTLIQEPTKKQPRKIPWLTSARANYFASVKLEEMWDRIVTPMLGKPDKR